MRFPKIMGLIALAYLPGTIVQMYGQEKHDEKQAKPEKQQAQPQRQQHAQQPKQPAQPQAKRQEQQHARQPKQEAQPNQRQQRQQRARHEQPAQHAEHSYALPNATGNKHKPGNDRTVGGGMVVGRDTQAGRGIALHIGKAITALGPSEAATVVIIFRKLNSAVRSFALNT